MGLFSAVVGRARSDRCTFDRPFVFHFTFSCCIFSWVYLFFMVFLRFSLHFYFGFLCFLIGFPLFLHFYFAYLCFLFFFYFFVVYYRVCSFKAHMSTFSRYTMYIFRAHMNHFSDTLWTFFK